MVNFLKDENIKKIKSDLVKLHGEQYHYEFKEAVESLMTEEDRMVLFQASFFKKESDYFSETMLKAYYHLEHLIENKHNIVFLAGVNVELCDNRFGDDYSVDVKDSVFNKTVKELFKSQNYYDYVVEYKLRKDVFVTTGFINGVLDDFIELREQISGKVYKSEFLNDEDYKNALIRRFISNEEYVKMYAILFYHLQDLHIYKDDYKKEIPELQEVREVVLKSLSKKVHVERPEENGYELDLTGALNFKNMFNFKEEELFLENDWDYIKEFKIEIEILSYDEVKERHQKSRLIWNDKLNCFTHEYKEKGIKKLCEEYYEPYHPKKTIENHKELNELINDCPKNRLFKINLCY